MNKNVYRELCVISIKTSRGGRVSIFKKYEGVSDIFPNLEK
jgi:hypothetical protein